MSLNVNLKNLFNSIFNQIINKGLNLLALPFVLLFMNEIEYGKLSIIFGFQAIVVVFVSYSARTVVLRFYGEYKELNLHNEFITKQITGVTIRSLLFAPTLFVLLIFDNFDFKELTLIYFLIILTSAESVLNPNLNISGKINILNRIDLAYAVFSTFIVCFLIYLFGGIKYYLLGLLISQFFKCLLLFKYSKIKLKFEKIPIKYIQFRNINFKYLLTQNFIKHSDKFLVFYFFGAGFAGKYHIFLQLVLIFELLSQSVNKIYAPILYQNQNINLQRDFTILYRLFLIVAVTGFILRDNLVTLLLPNTYWDEIYFLYYLIPGSFFLGLFKIEVAKSLIDIESSRHVKTLIYGYVSSILIFITTVNFLDINSVLLMYLVMHLVNFVKLLPFKQIVKNLLNVNNFVFILTCTLIDYGLGFLGNSGEIQSRWFVSFILLSIFYQNLNKLFKTS